MVVCRQPITQASACCRYCLIVLRADDNGQGGAFALFSLLKRQAELGKKSKVRAVQLCWHIDRGCSPRQAHSCWCMQGPNVTVPPLALDLLSFCTCIAFDTFPKCAPAAQLLMSERNLSQYTIGRGSTSLSVRLSSRKSSKAMPSRGLPTLKEAAPAHLNDWRQHFVEVGQLCSPTCKEWVNGRLPDYGDYLD
jgi:hypothetical protein